MKQSSLKIAYKTLAPLIEQENRLYSSSSAKKDLYKVEKTKEIGNNIFDNIIIKFTFLQKNMNDQQHLWIKRTTIRDIKNRFAIDFKTILRVLAKLYISKNFTLLSAIQMEIQQVIQRISILGPPNNTKKNFNPVNQTNSLSAESLDDIEVQDSPELNSSNPSTNKTLETSNPNPHPSEPHKNTTDQNAEMDQSATIQQLRSIYEDLTVQIESIHDQQDTSVCQDNSNSNDKHTLGMMPLDCSSISVQQYSDIDRSKCFYENLSIPQQIKSIPKQQQNMDPNNPIVMYLENEVNHASSQLTEFVHQYRMKLPVFTRTVQNRRCRIQCRLQIPVQYQNRFNDNVYMGLGSANSTKIAKCQAAKKILFSIFSKNPRIWNQFKAKKRIKGIQT